MKVIIFIEREFCDGQLEMLLILIGSITIKIIIDQLLIYPIDYFLINYLIIISSIII